MKKGAVKKSTKKDKDPNMPKRPPSAFFVFMYEYIYLRICCFWFPFVKVCNDDFILCTRGSCANCAMYKDGIREIVN